MVLDEAEKAEVIARAKAIQVIQEVRKVSIKDATEMAINGECSEIVHEYAYYSGRIVEHRILQNTSLIKISEGLLGEARDRIYSGLC